MICGGGVLHCIAVRGRVDANAGIRCEVGNLFLEATMNWKLTLLELLLAGFFAVACIRAGGMLSLERKRTLQ